MSRTKTFNQFHRSHTLTHKFKSNNTILLWNRDSLSCQKTFSKKIAIKVNKRLISIQIYTVVWFKMLLMTRSSIIYSKISIKAVSKKRERLKMNTILWIGKWLWINWCPCPRLITFVCLSSSEIKSKSKFINMNKKSAWNYLIRSRTWLTQLSWLRSYSKLRINWFMEKKLTLKLRAFSLTI